MASNTFVVLPAPSGNGTGASIDVSAMGAEKTITVGSSGGQYEPNVLVEISQDDVDYSPLTQFQGRDQRTLFVACRYMRQTVTRFIDGTNPSVGVGAPTVTENGYTPMDVPVGNGNGTALDSSALLAMKTVQVTGAFSGTINVDVSDDAGVTYTTIMSFAPGGAPFVTKTFTADHMRIGRAGIVAPAGLPTIIVADSIPGTDGGGGGGGGGYPPDLTTEADYTEDFNNGGCLLAVNQSGGPVYGSVYTTANSIVQLAGANNNALGGFGILQLQGVHSGGTPGVAQWSVDATKCLQTSDVLADFTIQWRVKPFLGASGTSEFIIGLPNVRGGVAWSDADPITFNTSGGADDTWYCTNEDTGIPVDQTTWTVLAITVTTDLLAKFYINNVLVSTQVVADPDSFTAGAQVTQAAVAATTALVYIDWVQILYDPDRSPPV